MTRVADDSLVVMSRQGTSHLSGGDLVRFLGNDDGSSWTGPVDIIDNSKDIRDAEVTTLASGDLICSYTDRTEATEDFAPHVILSTDEGATWGSPITVTNGFTAWAFITGKIVELGNGDLIAPLYGQDSGGGAGSDYIRVSRSQDGGATWADLATVRATGGGRAWSEPNITLLPSGDLICAIRADGSTYPETYLSTSTDDGATWSAVTFVFLGGGRPSIHYTPDAALVIAHRDTQGYGEMRWSFDDGATWSAGSFLGISQPYVYGSWVDLISGDLGLVWGYEEGSDTDGNLRFDAFTYVP